MFLKKYQKKNIYFTKKFFLIFIKIFANRPFFVHKILYFKIQKSIFLKQKSAEKFKNKVQKFSIFVKKLLKKK